MKRRAAFVVAATAAALVAGAFAATQPQEQAREAAACPAGSLRVTVAGKQRCLSLALRQRVWADVARARDRGSDGAPMLRAVAARHRLTAALVQRIVREGVRKGWRLPPAPALPAGARDPAPGGAGGLAAVPGCSAWARGQAFAKLSWDAVAGASEVRVAVSRFPGGLESGNLEASDPLPARRTSITWYRVHGQAPHRWRVLSRVGDRWLASATGEFEGPLCATPMQP